jgi:hypothetical protein
MFVNHRERGSVGLLVAAAGCEKENQGGQKQ